MTHLPELERQLFNLAQAHQQRRRRWWRIWVLSGTATLAMAGVASAVALFLPEGDPVPPAPQGRRVNIATMDPGTTRVLSVRASDPEGGLPWGVAVARSQDGRMLCAQVGRVQRERLGVLGRDEVFDNDGLFHPLSFDADQGGSCGGVGPDADFTMSMDGPPIPASGYTGSALSGAGGCRERLSSGGTMSKQTRLKLKDIPICDQDSLRLVKYGFAGRDAVKVRYGDQTLRPNAQEYGAYLFVRRPKNRRPTLVITYKDGSVCRSQPADLRPCPQSEPPSRSRAPR